MSNFKAVLVGINKYKRNKLRGCVNDVLVTRDILRSKHNVKEHQIRMLIDARATKQAILKRLKWLIDSSKDTEHLYFHYSGHGSQIPNQKYKADIEYDGMDEILCPVDLNWRGVYVTDDDIYKIVKKKNPDSRLVMVFDSCHSGTVYRHGFSDINDLSTFAIPRSIDAPMDILSRTDTFDSSIVLNYADENKDYWGIDQDDLLSDIKLPKSNPRKSIIGDNVIAISGCKDDQTSADAYFGARYQGALSYCLQKYMYRQPNLPVDKLFKKTVKYLKKFGFEQDPVITIGKKVDTSAFIIT